MGYEVIVAVRGADGIDQAVSAKPDLVLLDINLPDIDGFEVMRQFVGRKVRTRVIVFTQFAYIHWMVKFIRAGVCAYVTKPVDIEDLKLRVNAALKSENTMNLYRIETLTWEVKALMRKAEEQYEELMRLQRENSKLQEKLKFAKFGEPNSKYAFDVFVLMPFAPELRAIYDNHIMKTVKALNLSIARADDFFSQESIMDEIWSAIAYATILIADCTNKNPNVFYEIGLAHAIGKPVILTTQNLDDVPFDLRHRGYIQYTYTPAGMKKFEKDLSATISEIQRDLESSDK